jgi:5-methylcytosine-specific restriction endonuclease McrA
MGRITAELAAFLPAHSNLHTEAEIARVRGWLPPKVRAGHWLQPYKWQLACRLRSIRVKQAKGPPPTAARHRAMIEAAGADCPACGLNMQPWIDGRGPTIDHIIPLSRGGDNSPDNLRVICNVCNSRKSNRA